MSAVIQLRPPIAEKPTVVRGRRKNEAYRVREYLTEAEIAKLLTAAGKSVASTVAQHVNVQMRQAGDRTQALD